MSDGLDLKKVVEREFRERKGIYGDNMPKLIEYLRSRLGLEPTECSKTKLQAAVNSLIHEKKLVRKRFTPKPVAVSETRGEEGVIVYHSDFKYEPGSAFPPEFGEFVAKHHQLAAV